MAYHPEKLIAELSRTATDLRRLVMDMIFRAQSGHPGGSLSAADITAAAYQALSLKHA